jgi:hypothetical protein
MTGHLTLAITALTYLSGNAFELAELVHLSPVPLYNNNLTIRRLLLDILYGVSYVAVAVGSNIGHGHGALPLYLCHSIALWND